MIGAAPHGQRGGCRSRCRLLPPVAQLLVLVLAAAAAAGGGQGGGLFPASLAAAAAAAAQDPPQHQPQQHKQQQPHTSNWAVLVATSKYWYNYRHIANALSFYRTVRRLGVPDSNIILMLAEDVACNARNAYPGRVFNDESHALNVYGTNVEVDYRGYEVTVENFMRVLTGRHDPAVPRPKRMLSDRGSNVLVYISGHGGNEFMKFQDTQELMAQDVADAIAQMHSKGRYRELLLIVETCQAATLYSRITSPNVLAMASSLKDESSYSHTTDSDVGLSLIDRFTWSTLDFFEGVDIGSSASLADLMRIYRYEMLDSHFAYDASHYPRPLDSMPVTSFFGSVSTVRPTPGLTAAAVAADGGGGDAAAAAGEGGQEAAGAEAGGSATTCSSSSSGDGDAPASAAAAAHARLPAVTLGRAAAASCVDAGSSCSSSSSVRLAAGAGVIDGATYSGLAALLSAVSAAAVLTHMRQQQQQRLRQQPASA